MDLCCFSPVIQIERFFKKQYFCVHANRIHLFNAIFKRFFNYFPNYSVLLDYKSLKSSVAIILGQILG